ncbi:MAG: DNA polymerase III subunit delta [Flavobacterium sp. BFFFF2]|nr:MAG: DNA polymerase III subunit delta [Flavobacterium sp. BFFFF2]
MSKDVQQIQQQVHKGQFAPIYLLTGEEPYFVDFLTDFLQNNLIPEADRGFNQVVLYGKDCTIEEIVGQCRRYPMMAERQVVIVREAQELAKTFDQLEVYLKQPQPTTILVMAYKHKPLDKRKKIVKSIQQLGVFFESKKLYESDVMTWIKDELAQKSYKIEPKALAMLVENLGTDLGKIHNELSKMYLALPAGAVITPEHIEMHVGISKDFNVFELRKALGNKNATKALQIMDYFHRNPKDNPQVLVNGQLFAYFSQILQYHGIQDKSSANVAKLLGMNPFFVKDLAAAAQLIPMKKASSLIACLRDIDAKGKGVKFNQSTDSLGLMKELLAEVMG